MSIIFARLFSEISKKNSFIVKDSGMSKKTVKKPTRGWIKKKGGKEDGSPTMPLMLFNFYRVIRSWRKGRDFFARLEYKQDGNRLVAGVGIRRLYFTTIITGRRN